MPPGSTADGCGTGQRRAGDADGVVVGAPQGGNLSAVRVVPFVITLGEAGSRRGDVGGRGRPGGDGETGGAGAEHGGAESGGGRHLDRGERVPEDVGEHLPPGRIGGAAAGQAQVLDPLARFENMLQGVGDAFKKHELRPPRAMIAVGGMEGISDEAGIFLASRDRWKLASPPPRIFLFRSGGGAAARLLDKNPQPGSLWRKSRPDGEVFERLVSGLRNGDIVDAEAAWRLRHPRMVEMLSPEIPFQPYAAMTQWLLDEQLGPEG